MPSQDFPRLLFLTPCAFNAITGGGVTFTNLFRGWPKDRLGTITDDPVPVSTEVCSNYYVLTDAELRHVPPFHWLRSRVGRQPSHERVPTNGARRTIWASLAKGVLGTAGLPDRGQLSPALCRWVAQFRPQLIYSILGTPGYFDLLDEIAQHTGVPFVIHVMDHGTIAPRRTGIFRHYLRHVCAAKMRHLAGQARTCIAIGELMAAEYARRYGRPFEHFQNAIDLDYWPGVVPQCRSRRIPRLVYIGAMLPYAVLDSLRDCCRAVCELNRVGTSVQLEIYTPLKLSGPQVATLPRNPAIRVADVPADDAVFRETLQQADALLLPVNFDSASVHYIRLSMPTKIPAYLASGVPILVYGPAAVAQVAYARRHGWGHIVDQPSPARLQQGIRDILTNEPLRSALTSQARATVERFHGAALVRAGFQQVLIESSQPKGQRLAA